MFLFSVHLKENHEVENSENYNLCFREFVESAFKFIGLEIEWEGEGDTEIGRDKSTGVVRVKVNPKFYRPTEVEQLLGDPTKAKTLLKWEPKVGFDALVKDMMESDIALMKKNPAA